MNVAQNVIFQQTYVPKNVDDSLRSVKDANPSPMPPSAMVLGKKLDWANYVAKMCKRAALQNPMDGCLILALTKSSGKIGDRLPSDTYTEL